MNACQIFPGRYDRELQALGFTRADDRKAYRVADYVLESCADWATLRARGTRDDDYNGGSDFGLPGLWKSLSEPGRRSSRVFQIPLAFLGEDQFARQGEARFLRACVEWAMATAPGALRYPWSAPSRHTIEAILPPQALNIRAGAIVRQASLIHEESRVALRCPIVPVIPRELSPGRLLWLEKLLREGQDRWRMVRLAALDGATVQAEVDLSGAPPEVLEPLLRIAMDALRYVVRWVAPSTEFLIDAQNECRALELCRPQ